MIARIWQGRTRPKMGDAYYSYLERTGLREYHATESAELKLRATYSVRSAQL